MGILRYEWLHHLYITIKIVDFRWLSFFFSVQAKLKEFILRNTQSHLMLIIRNLFPYIRENYKIFFSKAFLLCSYFKCLQWNCLFYSSLPYWAKIIYLQTFVGIVIPDTSGNSLSSRNLLTILRNYCLLSTLVGQNKKASLFINHLNI